MLALWFGARVSINQRHGTTGGHHKADVEALRSGNGRRDIVQRRWAIQVVSIQGDHLERCANQRRQVRVVAAIHHAQAHPFTGLCRKRKLARLIVNRQRLGAGGVADKSTL